MSDGIPREALRHVRSATLERTVKVVLLLYALTFVAPQVLPVERWAPWWPPPETPLSAALATSLAYRWASSRRRALVVGLFLVAAVGAWSASFATWAGASTLAGALLAVAGLALFGAMIVGWRLLLGVASWRELRHPKDWWLGLLRSESARP